MAEDQSGGSDLTQGIGLADLADDGRLVGHVGDEQVLSVRRGARVSAVGANCTHYNGPLGDGLVVDETVRCPWHHAYFDPQKGEALRVPALIPIPTWTVEQHDGKNFVCAKRATPQSKPRGERAGEAADRMVIVGGGAGFTAAEMPRREQYGGRSSY
jgi:apoptosis-inducing factor 3